jgi:hypothetical protein
VRDMTLTVDNDVERLLREALETKQYSGLSVALKRMDKSTKEACLLRAVLWKGRDEETAEVVRLLLTAPGHSKLTAHLGSTNLLLEAVRHNKHKTIPCLIEEGCGTLLSVHPSEREDFIRVIAGSSVATKKALMMMRRGGKGQIVIDLSRYPVMHRQAHVDCSRLQFAALRDLGACVETLDDDQRGLEHVLTVLGKWEEARQWPEVHAAYALAL